MYSVLMDINLLVLNVGNSRTALGVFSGGTLDHVVRLDNNKQADWPAKLTEMWGKISGMPLPAVVGASVNPDVAEAIEETVLATLNRAVVWVGDEIDLPIHVATDKPKETGVDRVLNIAAAFEQIGKACVVVDAGTALTVDCCNDQGEFVGGAIAPGAGMMFAAMHEKTAKLPLVKLAAPADPWGKSTQEAMRHGVYHGIRGMVKELVENYATELGNWPEVIATGGDAVALFDGWELIHAISPDLTLYGIALAYTEHHIKHDG